MIVKSLAALALAYAGLCACLFALQRSMIYFPTPRSPGEPAQRLALAVDGATLQYWLVPRGGRGASMCDVCPDTPCMNTTLAIYEALIQANVPPLAARRATEVLEARPGRFERAADDRFAKSDRDA